MKATELYKVVPTFELVDKIRECDYSNNSFRAMITYPVILFVMLCNMILNNVILFVILYNMKRKKVRVKS